jgi:ElaB/YqjD/DUF883 family membrane-anchored ribosome-binding protein
MRTLGIILILVAVACLAVGVITLIIAAFAGPSLVERFQEVRVIIERNVDDAREVIDKVEDVLKETQSTVEDYDRGRIQSIDDERIKRAFGDIKSVLTRTTEIRAQAKESLQEIEDFKDEMEREAVGLAWVAAVCVAALVLSGWLLALGILALSMTRRKEHPTP